MEAHAEKDVGGFNISLIVPVLNEADQLESLARRLRLLKGEYVKEIIIVDGGSTDGTAEVLAEEFTLVRSQKGRAKQMNAGAAEASGAWLFFLHADTILGSQHIIHAMSEATLAQWGRFDVRLSGEHPAFRMIEFMINLRSSKTGIATGDQCIFVRRKLFDRVDGFADIPLMEDVELCKRLRKLSKPVCIKKHVVTSSRKWEKEGILKTMLLMWRLRFSYWLGASPNDLVKKYYR